MAFLSKKDEGLQVSMGFVVYLRMSVKHMPNRNAPLHWKIEKDGSNFEPFLFIGIWRRATFLFEYTPED